MTIYKQIGMEIETLGRVSRDRTVLALNRSKKAAFLPRRKLMQKKIQYDTVRHESKPFKSFSSHSNGK